MTNNKKVILLTIDLEEFDLPLEYNQHISKKEQLKISLLGLKNIMKLLDKYSVKATFFTTAYFAENNIEIMQSIVEKGHEIASHMYFHSEYNPSHILKSKQKLEEICKTTVYGIRSPRLRPLNLDTVKEAGYLYESSLNPTFIPGRYNNFNKSKVIHKNSDTGLFIVPFSVATFFRIPLFWLSFKNFNLSLFTLLANKALKRNGFLHLYFHPWEFVDITDFKLPFFIKKHSGNKMLERLEKLICNYSAKYEFIKVHEFCNDGKV